MYKYGTVKETIHVINFKHYSDALTWIREHTNRNAASISINSMWDHSGYMVTVTERRN